AAGAHAGVRGAGGAPRPPAAGSRSRDRATRGPGPATTALPRVVGAAGGAAVKAREAVLARVRDALGRSRHGPPPRPPRAYRTTSDLPVGAAVELLVERLVDYRARVHRCVPQEVAAHVGRLTAQAGSVVVPEGLERAWLAQVTAQVRTDSSAAPLSHAELD